MSAWGDSLAEGKTVVFRTVEISAVGGKVNANGLLWGPQRPSDFKHAYEISFQGAARSRREASPYRKLTTDLSHFGARFSNNGRSDQQTRLFEFVVVHLEDVGLFFVDFDSFDTGSLARLGVNFNDGSRDLDVSFGYIEW